MEDSPSVGSSTSLQPPSDMPDSVPSHKPAKTRRAITDEERKDLRAHKRVLMRENGKWSTIQMNEFFQEKYGRVLPQSTMTDTLSSKFDYLEEEDHPLRSELKRRRAPHWPELEVAVFDWQQQMLKKKITVTGEDLKRIAKKLFSVLPQYHGIEPPSLSHGWLDGYKARWGNRSHYLHDQSGAIDRIAAETEFDSIRKDLDKHGSEEDIYIMDETALFWKLSPDGVLTNGSPATSKSEKALLSVGLACNITGTHKLKPWFIGKAQTPRCFSRSAIHVENLPIVWQSNSKAWMSGLIFADYLKWFDSEMAGRKVYLLVDDSSAHTAGIQFIPPKHLDDLKNTRIYVLPTSYVPISHPMDRGITRSWKAHYRRRWLTYMCNEHDTGGDPMKSMNVLQAVRWGIAAWEDDVTPTTIRNAWIVANVLGQDDRPIHEEWGNAVIKDNRLIDSMLTAMEQQIRDLGRRNRSKSAMNIEAFINPAKETLDDKDIDDDDFDEWLVETYGTGAVERDHETDEEDVTVDQIGEEGALKLLSGLRLYEEQQPDGDMTVISQLNKYERDILARKTE